MNNDTNRTIFLSSSIRNHELTMLYLKQQDLSKLSISDLAQKYSDTKDEFDRAFKEQLQNKTYYI